MAAGLRGLEARYRPGTDEHCRPYDETAFRKKK